MYYYVPFSGNLTQGNTEEIAVADPGHLVGVFLRFKSGSDGFHPLWGQISISNIGTTKEYLLKNGIYAIFQRGTDGFVLNDWNERRLVPVVQHKPISATLNGIYAIFQRGTDGFVLNDWYQPAFIPLDHDIRANHQVLLETFTWGANFISVHGHFIYSK